MKKTRTCPICGREYSEHPAMSRKDGKEICPECGAREALDAVFGLTEKEKERIIKAMHQGGNE